MAWITGAGGLIGSALTEAGEQYGADWKVRPLTRKDLDLTDFAAVEKLFTEEQPGLIIHCAALSHSPTCEQTPALAWKINFEATRFLSQLAKNIRFIFFSSDLVFDGQKGNYLEQDKPNPLSVYAETKVAAEEAVGKTPRHVVVRTSLNGGRSPTGDRGFNEQIRRAWERGESLRLFTDEFRCPTPAMATAQAVWGLASSGAGGTFHIAGADRMSRWEIGKLMAERWPELQPKLEPASLKEYRGAPRPPDTSLNCAKIEALLGYKLPGWRDWLSHQPKELG